MRITRKSEAAKTTTRLDAAHFTGAASSRDLTSGPQHFSAFAAVVRFETGVRNHWHAHAGGQLLHVIEGEGWVQSRGQEPQRITAGDTVAADANEEHWHGAGQRGPMAHLAFAVGETRWMERSPEPPD